VLGIAINENKKISDNSLQNIAYKAKSCDLKLYTLNFMVFP
jgi:hypothetical protein